MSSHGEAKNFDRFMDQHGIEKKPLNWVIQLFNCLDVGITILQQYTINQLVPLVYFHNTWTLLLV